MSSILSNNKLTKSPWTFGQTLIGLLFVIGCILTSNILVIVPFLLGRIDEKNLSIDSILDNDLLNTLVMFTQGLAVIIGVILFLRLIKIPLSALSLRRLSVSDLKIALACFLIYLPASSLVTYLTASLIQGFDVNQEQDLGLQFDSVVKILSAFLMIVIMAPISEELLLRGFIYRGLCRVQEISLFKKIVHISGYRGKIQIVGDIFSIIVTSILFGLAHGQWNVGIDTFVLSIFMIIAFRLSGNLMVPILIHGIKNLLAFLLITLTTN